MHILQQAVYNLFSGQFLLMTLHPYGAQ